MTVKAALKYSKISVLVQIRNTYRGTKRSLISRQIEGKYLRIVGILFKGPHVCWLHVILNLHTITQAYTQADTYTHTRLQTNIMVAKYLTYIFMWWPQQQRFINFLNEAGRERTGALVDFSLPDMLIFLIFCFFPCSRRNSNNATWSSHKCVINLYVSVFVFPTSGYSIWFLELVNRS